MFSKTVKQALLDANMNVAELARKTGYSAMYIHNLLNGNRRWNEESMGRVCQALGLEISVGPKHEVVNGGG